MQSTDANKAQAGLLSSKNGVGAIIDIVWKGTRRGNFSICDRVVAIAAIFCLLIFSRAVPVQHWVNMALPNAGNSGAGGASVRTPDATGSGETLIAGYVGNPIYYRSNVNVTRPDGTDLKLKGLGWDGDALHFPIDGGVRYVRWHNNFGFMIDFLHNKAVARLGRGAHGRKLKYPVIEEVEASGTFKGKPVPPRIRLTDIFDRLEFTHGHNLLYFTGMFRLTTPIPGLRPYAGLGAGFAIPHVEVWFAGEGKAERTNEYQYAGPTTQALLGLELQVGQMSYFVEYKFSYAWIFGALTADKSWKNWNMPGDLFRQFNRWWQGEEPKRGRFSTTLGAHQIIVGAGYRPRARVQPKVLPGN